MERKTFVALAASGMLATGSSPAVASAGDAEPPRTFAASVDAIGEVIARDRSDPSLAATAMPRFYHHGRPVEHAVVLFHGFTNCPQQFDAFARSLHDRGCNVYVPRIPLHGKSDRLTLALADLTAAGIAGAADTAFGLARGLGTSVSVLGLSLGGAMALHLARTQPVDHAVAVAPFLMPIGVPGWLGMPLMRVVSWLPDRYVWWDPRIKERCLPAYAYPGFPSHALAECIFFGDTVVNGGPPRARRTTLVVNQNESAVNNAYNERLIRAWTAAGARCDRTSLTGLGPPPVHDIIDPTTFPQAHTLVYPALEALVLGA